MGILILIISIKDYITNNNIQENILKITAGIFTIIPGFYSLSILIAIKLGSDKYSYEDIA